MPKASRTVIGLVLVGVAAFGAWKVGTTVFGSEDDATSTNHLVNHVWIERLPQNRRDMIGHLALVDHPRGKIGVAGRSSQWRHFVELFQWKLQGHRLSVFFPQEEVRGDLKARTWNCEDEAPEPFQLCLELSAQNGQKVVYYSRRDWVIEPHSPEASFEALEERVPELAGVFAHTATEVDAPFDANSEADSTNFTVLTDLGPFAIAK